MKRDLIVELWETKPKIIEKRNDETFEVSKEVVLDANNIPVIEKKMRGVRYNLF